MGELFTSLRACPEGTGIARRLPGTKELASTISLPYPHYEHMAT